MSEIVDVRAREVLGWSPRWGLTKGLEETVAWYRAHLAGMQAVQRSLVGNAVLRWEYRPGSTLFLVWQRQQRGRIGDGSFDFGRDLGALFDAPADNVFMVKVNYWLGL